MKVIKLFRRFSLQNSFKNDEREYFFDPYRQKNILIKPEENVRQWSGMFVEQKLNVPHDCIRYEQHMAHFHVASNDRVDIVILYPQRGFRKNNSKPLAVIECKSTNVLLTEVVTAQAERYARALKCSYFFTTNGVEFKAFQLQENAYQLLKRIPLYPDMLGRKKLHTQKAKPFKRFPFLFHYSFICREYYMSQENSVIGYSTDKKQIPTLIRLYECLLDESHKLPKRASKVFKFKRDCGVRSLSYGCASGGTMCGDYRSFEVVTSAGSTLTISISLSSYFTDSNPTVYTIIAVGIEEGSHRHHSVQIQTDKNLVRADGGYLVTHDGRISIGNIGSGSINALLEMVKEQAPRLLKNGRVELGFIPKNRVLMLEQPDIASLVYNLMEYALIRDFYRSIVKEKRVKKNTPDIIGLEDEHCTE
ncbi:MAG: type I restriction enzyme HsdR N-terminal domain-containing protein [Clostridiaceae bacterium]